MSTLAEIEAAAETLPEQEKEQLFLFLAARLRAANPAELPPPCTFGRERMEEWIRDDEAGMRRFRDAFSFLADSAEDIYTAADGEPLRDTR